MKTPVIVVNFKTYREVMGGKALELAKTCEDIAKKTKKSIAIAPQQVDLALVSSKVEIPVLAQHTDNIDMGSHTGHVTPEAIKATGAKGTLLNHSEHRMKIMDIHSVIQRCKKIDLETIVCTSDIQMSRECAPLDPDFIAIEPPELIGGDVSVTTANPEIVRGAVREIKKINPRTRVLTGAGIRDHMDVKKAIELGTCGVLLASGVVKARDPRKALLDLTNGL